MSEPISTTNLLEAVEDCLRRELLPALAEDRQRYLLRVCLNALGMVQRDVANTSDLAEALDDLRKLAGSGTASESDDTLRTRLARALREGSVDGCDAQVIASLRRWALARARRANPAFIPSAERGAEGS